MSTTTGAQDGKKKLILNAFVMMCTHMPLPPLSLRWTQPKLTPSPHTGSGHQSPGLWRHPQDESWRFDDVEHWVDLAKTLEAAKFHGIFIADVLGKPTRPLPYPDHLRL